MYSENLLRLAHMFSSAAGKTLSTIGTYAAGHGAFFSRLESGHDITTKRAAKVICWFSNHWPADLAWPPDIPRPTPSPDSEGAKNLNNSPSYSENDPRYKLNDKGQIASPNAFIAKLGGIDRASYDQVVRQYADGKPRCKTTPRPHTSAHRILSALARAGDRRFASRRQAAEATPQSITT